MANLAPILLAGGALFLVAKGKKKKKKKSKPYGTKTADAGTALKPPPPSPEQMAALPKHAPGPSETSTAKKEVIEKRQQGLVDLNYDIGKSGVDGVWGPASKAATEDFQEDAGIAVDGKWGPITDSAMAQALIRLAKGIVDVVTPAIGAGIDTVLGAAGAIKEFGESWFDDEPEVLQGEVVLNGEFANAEWRIREVDDEGVVISIGEYRVKGQDGWMKAAESTDMDEVAALTEDAAQRASDAAGSGPPVSGGSEWGPDDILVMDGECKYMLHISDQFFDIQRRLTIRYALDDMFTGEDAEEIHERMVAEYAPMCASLGRDGISKELRSWWDQNISHVFSNLQRYKLLPEFLEEDAEKHGN